MTLLPEHVPVAIVGGGQAGLSMSWHLAQRGIEHAVVERSRAFHAWHEERWDAFTLVTPNFQCRLPGHPYPGDEPEGFMGKLEILAYLDDFLQDLAPPLYEGVAVTRLGAAPRGFELETTSGTIAADQVVVAVGGYHTPWAPPAAQAGVPATIAQLHSNAYRNPESLPEGAVLVVGTGQSGAQIAEDLHLAGRQVHLCVGGAPRCARTYRGRDVVSWLEDMGHYDLAIEDHPEGTAARKEANHYVTGRDGGRDLDLRVFAAQGMQLHGLLRAVDGGVATFGDDLRRRLDDADATYDRINAGIDRWIAAQGIETTTGPSVYEPVWQPPAGPPAPLNLAAAGIGAVVWCTGFRPDWSWVDVPFLDETGYPDHQRGVVAATPGLYVLGLPWLNTWGSGRFAAVARDAEHLATQMAPVAAR
ncbi:MAG TPA: MSMEG_0569 family flavin-dependent oxidoreductase [Solirubrobacteraceae bacterium]|jgi:putative flavoprotein involved in K+ transport|nr:MSMEG_0569 family flavin-dependent oxidoreductase [Solirubrobacteraceae bacterium]